MERDATTGRFKPGSSGNPGGRPRDTPHAGELARSLAGLAIFTWARLCSDQQAPPHVQLRAAELLMQRGFGRPRLAAEHPELPRYALLRSNLDRLLERHVRDEGAAAHGQSPDPDPADFIQ